MTSPDNIIREDVKKFGLLLDAHHAVLYALIAAALFGLSYLWTARQAGKADQQAAVAAARYEEARRQNTDFQQRVAQELAELKQRNDDLFAQNRVLSVAITARDRQLADQRRKNTQLAPPELAQRWGNLIELPGTIVPTPDLGYAVTAPAALATVQGLEELPVLRANTRDLGAQIINLQEVVTNGDQALGLEKQAHARDNQTCVLGLGAKDAEIKKVKADAARGKRRWGVVGFVLGAIARGFIGR